MLYQLSNHSSLEKVVHLFPENALIGGDDIVPGVREGPPDGESPWNVKKYCMMKDSRKQTRRHNDRLTDDRCINKWMYGLTGGWMDGQMDGETNDERMNRCHGWVVVWVSGWMDGWVGQWMDGWMDGWMMDVWIDRWMDEWTDR